jgi:hypothetical protein
MQAIEHQDWNTVTINNSKKTKKPALTTANKQYTSTTQPSIAKIIMKEPIGKLIAQARVIHGKNQKELASMPVMENLSGPYAEEKKAITDFKKILLMVAGAAAKSQMDGKINLKEEQEILFNLSDMLTDLFLAESTLLRVEKLSHKADKQISQSVYDAILKVFLHDASFRMQKNATDALSSFSEGDLLKTFLMGVKRFSKYPVQPVKEARRIIANCLILANGYVLNA